MLIKPDSKNCRRELVNAYRAKPTARKKTWQTVKRLLYDGDRLNFLAAVGGRVGENLLCAD